MRKKKALFLDRDGVIVNECQVDSFEKIVYLPHMFSTLAKIRKQMDFEFVLVSNQDGVGTPAFPYEDYIKCQERIMSTLEGEDIFFDDVNIDFSTEDEGLDTRKPNIGMLKAKYIDSNEYDMSSSFFIGDRITDMMCARNLGCKGILLSEDEIRIPDDLEATVCLKASSWLDILSFFFPDSFLVHRTSNVARKTAETDISITVDLDGSGKGEVKSGIPFFDHMMAQFIKYSRFDISSSVSGDIEIDCHHTVEDYAITLGTAIKNALSDKRGIERYGYEILVMDEARATVALDFSSRPYLDFSIPFTSSQIGDFPTEMIKHFLYTLSVSLASSLSVRVEGENNHHMAEACFKALGRAMRYAVRRKEGYALVPSTKGCL